jgi:hypothetical protein
MDTQHIYVELLDEGTIVYRPVSATHIRDRIFKIEGIVPETETWAFLPGEIVGCRHQQFSDDKWKLVAFRSLLSDESENL